MFFRRAFGLIIGAVLLFGIGGIMVQNAYRSGWQQGYLTAKVDSLEAAGGESDTAVPPVAPFNSRPHGMDYDGWGYSGHGPHGFNWFGFVAVIFLGLFLLKFLFGWGHRRRWHGRHGPKGHPWVDDDEPVQKA